MSIMDLQRKNFRGGGGQIGGTADMSGGSSTNQGPAGGASTGGNYGGNSSGGYTDKERFNNRGNNGPSPTPKSPPKKPKPTKDNTIKKNIFESYFDYSPVPNILNKITKSKFNTNVNAKRREQYLNDLLETDPNEYNRVMGQLSKVNMIVGPQGITSQVPPSMGFTQTDYGMPSAPPGMLTSNFEEIDGRKSLGDPAALEILGQKYKDTLPTFDGDREGNDNILPQYAMMGGGADMGSEDVEPYNQFTYDEDAFGLGGDSADVTRASYDFNQGGRAGKAEGGIMELRARRAFGGIMDRVDKRQGYFLGGIGKAIKGVVGGVADAAGKVLKSDVGKMAIAGAAFYYGGGGSGMFAQGSAGGGGWMGGLKAMGGNFMSSANPLLFSGGKLSLGKLGLASAALPFLMPAAKPNETSFSDRGGSLIDPITGLPAKPAEMRASLNNALDNADGDPIRIKQINDAYAFLGPDERLGTYSPYRTYGVKDGGRIGKAEGGLLDLGGMEKDYRAEGGFVPIGEYEKKDDVPARLSVNEFVFTADAVRGAGQGDIDKGAEIMENMMKNLEKGGTISEESQGNIGAQQMFETSERLGEVI